MDDLVVQSVALAKASPRINALERDLVANYPKVECPVVHRFTPGLYSRECFMPAGSCVTSKIHRTEHQFVVLAGRCRVFTEDEGVVELEAGHVGITKPGTRRVLAMLTDVRWITFHPVESQDLVEIEEQLIEPHDIPEAATMQLGEVL